MSNGVMNERRSVKSLLLLLFGLSLSFLSCASLIFRFLMSYPLDTGFIDMVQAGFKWTDKIRSLPQDIIFYQMQYGNSPVANNLAKSWQISGVLHAFLFLIIIKLMEVKRSLYGDAKFAEIKDIEKAQLFVPQKQVRKDNGLFAGDRIIVGKVNNRYIGLGGQLFAYLAAPTRSGKGVGVVIPVGLSYDHSMVVSDIKQELFEITGAYRRACGHKVYLFDPFNPQGKTHRWNPLSYVHREPEQRVDDLNQIAICLIPDSGGDDKFFEESARKLFIGLGLYCLDIEEYNKKKKKEAEEKLKEQLAKEREETEKEIEEEDNISSEGKGSGANSINVSKGSDINFDKTPNLDNNPNANNSNGSNNVNPNPTSNNENNPALTAEVLLAYQEKADNFILMISSNLSREELEKIRKSTFKEFFNPQLLPVLKRALEKAISLTHNPILLETLQLLAVDENNLKTIEKLKSQQAPNNQNSNGNNQTVNNQGNSGNNPNNVNGANPAQGANNGNQGENNQEQQASSYEPPEEFTPTIRAILDLATDYQGESIDHFNSLMNQRHIISDIARQSINSAVSAGEETFASILATLTANLTSWLSEPICNATSGNDFDLRDVRKQRMTIYIGIQPKDLAKASKIINLFYSQLINENTSILPQSDPKTYKYQCLMLMDEGTAAGRIAILEKAVSYMAGYNMRLLFIAQSPAQLQDKNIYGEHGTRNILTNIALKVLYKPNDVADSEEYSKLLGKITVSEDTSKSRGGGNRGVSRTESLQQRDLMMPQELRAMSKDKEIIIFEGINHPIAGDKNKYYLDPIFKARFEGKKPLEIKTLQSRGKTDPNRRYKEEQEEINRIATELAQKVLELEIEENNEEIQKSSNSDNESPNRDNANSNNELNDRKNKNDSLNSELQAGLSNQIAVFNYENVSQNVKKLSEMLNSISDYLDEKPQFNQKG